MNRFLFLLSAFFFVSAVTGAAQYMPDVLGYDYEQQTFNMADDYEGKVTCTLVRKRLMPDTPQAVLYIHGYNDYFFQAQLGDSVQAYGYNFYALDLRKHGRSILPHQEVFFCKQLDEYFADIDSALVAIRAEGHAKIILMAHSTGGLIAPLYLNTRGDSVADGMILNSPFMDMNMNWFMGKIMIPVVSFIGKIFPNMKIQGYGLASYAKSLLRDYQGEWEFDTNWKRMYGHPKKAGWIHAIHSGHKKVQKGLNLNCPILVLSSDESFPETEEWHEKYQTSDIILDVNDIQNHGMRLGANVTLETISNGMHDLILSQEPHRTEVYRKIKHWFELW